MDINDIQNNLNNFEFDSEKVFGKILNTSFVNQAYMEAILNLQIEILKSINPDSGIDNASISEVVRKRIIELQTDFSRNN